MTFQYSFSIKENYFLQLAQYFSKENGTILLYSAGTHYTKKRSLLFLFPDRILLPSKDPWQSLKRDLVPVSNSSFPKWSGYLSYEMGSFLQDKKVLSFQPKEPLFYFQTSFITSIYNHDEKKLSVTVNERLKNIDTKLFSLFSSKDRLSKFIHSLQSIHYKCKITHSSDENELDYLEKVHKAKDYIIQGDIYQVNLARELNLIGEFDPFDVFLRNVKLNPPSFAAFLNIDKFQIISTSPERFLRSYDDKIESFPIKGTAPRGLTPEEDQHNLKKLLSSEKEKAELVMITDLMRNDLGKVCKIGSVKVKKIFSIEKHENVFHLLSQIEGKKRSFHPIDIVKNCFPGGSITGCPKIRAMEIIYELEKKARGVYTGSIGYFSENGDFDLNIAIRTLLIQKDTISLQLGSGIVYDSDPVREFHETHHKGSSIYKSLSYDKIPLTL